jgi:hypothetical protein
MCRVIGRFSSAAAAVWTAAAAGRAASGIERPGIGAGAAGLDGERYGDTRAGAPGSDANVTLEVQHALAHAGDANTRSLRLYLAQYLGGDAAAFVLDVE